MKTRLTILSLIAAAALAGTAAADPILGYVRVHTAVASDTLVDLARDNGLGYGEIVAANQGVDPWLPRPGTHIILPTAHLYPDAPQRGIVINLADQRLYYFPPGRPPETYPIGVPVPEVPLRTGTTQIIAKRENPTWIPTASEHAEDPDLPDIVPPGPDNPLGSFALYTDWTAIVIHGTNRPYGIGRRVSHGCIRLYPEDIETLFNEVPMGTPVTFVNQPAKVGWVGATLFLEVHPTPDQAYELETAGKFTPEPVPGLDRLVLEAAVPFEEGIDWRAVDETARARTGVPTPISRIRTAAQVPSQ